MDLICDVTQDTSTFISAQLEHVCNDKTRRTYECFEVVRIVQVVGEDERVAVRAGVSQ